jgi:hypothetical protein
MSTVIIAALGAITGVGGIICGLCLGSNRGKLVWFLIGLVTTGIGFTAGWFSPTIARHLSPPMRISQAAVDRA